MRILLDGSYGPKVHYAFAELEKALTASGESVESVSGAAADLVAGTPAGSERIAGMNPGPAAGAESLAIGQDGSTTLVAGSDEQGLMYALLEVAEKIAFEHTALADIAPSAESPETSFRGLYVFLHNADCERDWFYSRENWESYFDLLARSRYNSFHIVMAHQTNYLAPPFPFFVDVPQHPEVVAPSLGPGDRERNLDALNMIAGLAEDRGLDFVVGIWEVIAWKSETGHGAHTQKSMVDGLDWGNLESYTYHATKRLLAECPKIKGIQIRANAESGVPAAKQTTFFSNTIFKAIGEADHKVFLDLRGWLAEPQTLQAAKGMGIPMRLSMKYWAEHLGAPYQAAMQNPAYSYADFLRYPQECPISYQVWALGSHRNFLWGDPEYVRTFCHSLTLGDGIGFEICPQLAQKGYGNEPGAWRVLEKDHEYYTWEWQRYWMYHLLFGRLTYNSQAAENVWMRRMRALFSDRAQEVMDALETASRVVTFLMRFNMSDPNMYIWPEADTGGLLDFYIEVPPSDPSQIMSFGESATERLSGEITARSNPRACSTYLRSLGDTCIAAAKALKSGSGGNKELASTLVDIEALGELALYHAEKILAGASLALYYDGGDYAALDDVASQLPLASRHWHRLAEITDGVYTDRQVTGPIDSGHWKDKTVLIREDEARVKELVQLHRSYGGALLAFDFGGVPAGMDYGYSRIRATYGYHVEKGFVGVGADCLWSRRTKGYGWTSQASLTAVTAPLARFCDWHLDTISRDDMRPTGWDTDLTPLSDELYRDYVGGTASAAFTTDVPAGRYEVTLVFGDKSTSARSHGPFTIRLNGDVIARSVTTEPERITEVRGVYELGRGVLEVGFEPDHGSDWFVSALLVRPVEPKITHTPIWTASVGEDIAIRVGVSCPDTITQVRLVVSDARKPTVTPMNVVEPGLLFEATIPRSKRAKRLDYWFEADSETGLSTRYPSLTDVNRSFALTLYDPKAAAPAIDHAPVHEASPGRAVAIGAEVSAGVPLSAVRLHYRYTNQFYDWRVVDMAETDSGYTAEIPGSYVVADWDLMYYLEAIDSAGRGVFDPVSDPVRQIPYHVIKVQR